MPWPRHDPPWPAARETARARSALPGAGQRRAARGSGRRRGASVAREEEEDQGGAAREEGRGRGSVELRPEEEGRRGAPMAGAGREQGRPWPRRGEGAEQRGCSGPAVREQRR